MKTKALSLLKNKKVIISSMVIITVFVGTLTINAMTKRKVLKLRSNEIYVEYGTYPMSNLSNYLDTSSLDKDTKKDVLDNAVLTVNFENELDSEFAKIGEYEGTISYKDEIVKFKLIVRDTKAPTMLDFKPWVNTYVDVIPDYKSIYTANDLSGEVVVEIDDSNINYSTIGTYEATITATDVYENIFTIKITVAVKEPTLEVSQTEITLNEGDTSSLIVTVKGKEEKATFTSNDNGIATVDENGTITANNAGTATITITANSVEKIVMVTVNAKPVTNTSSGGSSSSGSNSSNTSNSNSNNNSSSSTNGNSDSGGTPSNTCTYSYTPIDDKFFNSYSEMESYFMQTYFLTNIYSRFGYSTDSCGRYYIDTLYQ